MSKQSIVGSATSSTPFSVLLLAMARKQAYPAAQADDVSEKTADFVVRREEPALAPVLSMASARQGPGPLLMLVLRICVRSSAYRDSEFQASTPQKQREGLCYRYCQ